MKTITKKDNVYIVVGEWFDKINGNTYHDATITINQNEYFISYRYGYDASSDWNLKELLNQIGFRIRKNKRVHSYCKVYTQNKTKKQLNK